MLLNSWIGGVFENVPYRLQIVTHDDLFAGGNLAPRLLALNNAHALELSILDHSGLRDLVAKASVALTVDECSALLIALDHRADYDSENYRWFRGRFERFIYVDRVVVDANRRSEGIATALYHGLFEWARRQGHRTIACEINISPPNPASTRFHNRLGFAAVGEATLTNAQKTVRYYIKGLSAA